LLNKVSVGHWEGSLHVDSTHTLTFLHGKSDVALFSPLGSERVSDNPVVLAVLVTITDNVNYMIKLGSTFWGVEDTTLVLEEDWLRSLDTNRYDMLGGSSLKLLS
jgi:hypothetical protein